MNRLIDFSSRFRILKGGKISLVVSAMLGSAIIASASPSGGTVTSGTVTISSNGTVTNIDQSTAKATINWQTFSIATGETVNFNQPDSSSITLNRVIGNEKSIIDGALNANGQVWLLNSNGVLFSKNASINTSGILATTAELSDSDFNAGNYDFKNSSSNSVINQGTINVSNAGSVVLASNEVINEGTIKAVKGKVHLVGADSYSLNLNGNSLVNLRVDKGVLDALVKNSGHIVADGGEIYLTTNAVDELLKGVVNNTGIIEANSIDDLFGKVELFAHGGTAEVNGTIEALGGFVETSGDTVKIDDDFKIETKEWLIDPTNITVESTGSTSDLTSSSIKASFIENTLNAGTGVTLQADQNIYVNEDITWSSSSKLTLDGSSVYINAPITASNNSGKVELKYNTQYYINSPINLKAGPNFITNGVTWTVITSLGSEGSTSGIDLQGINGNLSGNYVLGADIDASDTKNWDNTYGDGGFMPLGSNYDGYSLNDPFEGDFDGLGHTISNLYIDIPEKTYVGLFSVIDYNSTVSNLKLSNVDITSFNSVAGIAGYLQGTINNSIVTGNIKGEKFTYEQYNYNDELVNTIVYTPSKIASLVGYSTGSINNSYSTATLSIDSDGSDGEVVAGLVGELFDDFRTTISNSYFAGTINGGDIVGGIVGESGSNPIISNTYYDKTKLSSVTVGSNYGKSTSDLQKLSTFSSFDIGGGDGEYPSLAFEFSNKGTSTWYMDGISYLNYTLSNEISTYDGKTQNLTDFWSASTLFGSSYSSWLLGADYVFKYSGDTVNNFTNAGTYSDISVDILKTGFDESSSGNTNGKLTINKATATVTANSKEVTYNGLEQSVSGFTATGLVNNETISVLDEVSASVAKTNAGEYDSLLAGDDENYDLTFVDGKLTINKATATVTANSKEVTYNGLEQSVSGFTATGLVNNETISVLDEVSASVAKTNAGEYDSLLAGDDENYDLTFVDGKLTINKATATVTANSKEVTYNGLEQSVSGFTATGLVNNETISVLDEVSASVAKTNAGEYDSLLAGDDENYDLTFVDGKLTINPKVITVSADDLNKVANTLDPTLTYVIDGLVSGDKESGILIREIGEKPGTYTINQGLLTAGENYSIIFSNNIFTIISDVMTPIANSIVVPKAPTVRQKATQDTKFNLVSTPVKQNQNTKVVLLSELKQTENNDVVVPVGDNSIISLINGGVTLPEGVDQQFYVIADEAN